MEVEELFLLVLQRVTPDKLEALPKNWRQLLAFYQEHTNIRTIHLVIPLVLAMVSALFEASTFALLIPLSKGIALSGFDFVSQNDNWPRQLLALQQWFASQDDRSAAIILVSAILVSRGLRLGTDYGRDLFLRRRDIRFDTKVRLATFERILSFGRRYFEQRAVGQVNLFLEWAGTALTLLREIEDTVASILKFVAKLAVMFVISLPLTALMILCVPIVQLIFRALNRRVLQIAHKVAEIRLREQKEAFDVLSMIPLVKAFSAEDGTVSKYGDVLDESAKAKEVQEKLRLLERPLQEIVVFATMAIALIANMFIDSSFDLSQLAMWCAFLVVAQQSMNDYQRVNRLFLVFLEKAPVLRALADLLEDQGKFKVDDGKKTLVTLKESIHCKKLCYGYRRNQRVLIDIDGHIPAGQFTAIVGTSGSGKSTLTDLLMRFYPYRRGMIFLDKNDIADFSLESLHNQIALVSQETWLLHRSLRDNLCFGSRREIDDPELESVLAIAQLPASKFEGGLDSVVGDRGIKLSGGEKQRLAIARAILRRPEILILDEATSALDSQTEARVMASVAEKMKGKTVIAVAHRLASVRDANYFWVLEDGQLAECGSGEQLLNQPSRLRDMFERQGLLQPKRTHIAKGG